MEIFLRIQNDSFVDDKKVEKINKIRFYAIIWIKQSFLSIWMQQNARLHRKGLPVIAEKEWKNLHDGSKHTIRFKLSYNEFTVNSK